MDTRRDLAIFSSFVLFRGARKKVLTSSASEVPQRFVHKLFSVLLFPAFVGRGLDAGVRPLSLITTTKTQSARLA